MPILDVQQLEVSIPTAGGLLKPVRDLSIHVDEGETLCIVGESGSGKSLTSLAIMDLLPRKARREARALSFAGQNLLDRSSREMSHIRGADMAMIFQEPMTSLNPAYTVGDQLEEAYLLHRRAPRREARDRAILMLEKVGIPGAAGRLRSYPHQLSGGQRQRVMIAMALMCGPRLLIADEPTTALDVTIQAQILSLLISLQNEFRMAMILITHDLGVVANVADRVAVMYAGEIVETGAAADVLRRPKHPYTQGLLACLPVPGETPRGSRLGSIPGIVPNLASLPPGCKFAERCPHAVDACRQAEIAMRPHEGATFRCLFTPEERGQNSMQRASA
jgi:peptide/nickel transport system ATP-binding protein